MKADSSENSHLPLQLSGLRQAQQPLPVTARSPHRLEQLGDGLLSFGVHVFLDLREKLASLAEIQRALVVEGHFTQSAFEANGTRIRAGLDGFLLPHGNRTGRWRVGRLIPPSREIPRSASEDPVLLQHGQERSDFLPGILTSAPSGSPFFQSALCSMQPMKLSGTSCTDLRTCRSCEFRSGAGKIQSVHSTDSGSSRVSLKTSSGSACSLPAGPSAKAHNSAKKTCRVRSGRRARQPRLAAGGAEVVTRSGPSSGPCDPYTACGSCERRSRGSGCGFDR